MIASQANSAPASLRLQLFGPFEVWLDGRPLPRLRSRKSLYVLALLALRQGAEIEREWLAGLLWPERGDRQALRNSLAELRRALGPAAHRLRSLTTRTLSLDLAGAAVDLFAFDAAIARGDPASLTEAVALYRGSLLEGCAEEWVFPERQAREQAYLMALERLAAAAMSDGDVGTAEAHLRRAAAVDPLRESSQRALMEALAAGGNYTSALLCYRELRLRLHRELNAEPDPETKALFEQIRAEARRLQRRPAARTGPALRPEPGPQIALAAPLDLPPLQPRVVLRPSSLAVPAIVGTRSASPAAQGIRTPTAGENRLMTVLFAGMGRSVVATQELDPEEAAALVTRLLGIMADAIRKFGGQVDRFLGDGLLAIFGMPQAHEDDAERAVRAALEIQEAARGLEIDVTAGINTGGVYLGAIDSDRHHEVSIAGPVVSLASWLQAQAEPDQILVGEGTYRQTRRAFEYSPHFLEIKGRAEPVTAYAVAGALTRPQKTRGIEGLQAELIGRAEELARLKAAVAALVQGRGQMISLIGEAGVGKSRLVAELKAAMGGQRSVVRSQASPGSADERDCLAPSPRTTAARRCPPLTPSPLWLEGRCLELSTAAGYSVFVDLFRDYFAWRPDEDDRGAPPPAPPEGWCGGPGERLAASLREFTARGVLPAERVEEMGPLLGNLLSLRFDTDWDGRLLNASPEQIRYQTFLAVRDFLVALSRSRPLLLVLEDLHWADSLSLNLLSLLMESLPFARLGLLCVYRPERAHKCSHLATIAERKCPESFTELRLRELTPEQSGQLVQSLLPIERLPGTLKAKILDKSRGNPFFLEELVRSLIDSRLVYREGEQWKAREGVVTIALPESVESLILSRFDRLRPHLKQLLRSAAVIGRLFRLRVLERVVGVQGFGCSGVQEPPPEHSNTRTPEHLNTALSELEDQGLVYEERAVPEVEYDLPEHPQAASSWVPPAGGGSHGSALSG